MLCLSSRPPTHSNVREHAAGSYSIFASNMAPRIRVIRPETASIGKVTNSKKSGSTTKATSKISLRAARWLSSLGPCVLAVQLHNRILGRRAVGRVIRTAVQLHQSTTHLHSPHSLVLRFWPECFLHLDNSTACHDRASSSTKMAPLLTSQVKYVNHPRLRPAESKRFQRWSDGVRIYPAYPVW